MRKFLVGVVVGGAATYGVVKFLDWQYAVQMDAMADRHIEKVASGLPASQVFRY
jgi:hypothetical protein